MYHSYLQFVITQGCNGRAKKGEGLRYAKTDFTNGKGDYSILKAQLADDGEELSRSNHANSTMVKAGQRLYEDNATPLPAAMYGLDVGIIEDDDGPLLPPAMSTAPFDGDSPDLDAARTAASRYAGKLAKARPEVIQDNTGLDVPVSMMEFTDSKKMEPIVTRPPRPINIAEIGDAKDALKKGQPPPRQQITREDSIVIPPSEDMDGDDLRVHTNRREGRAEEYIVNANVAPSNPGMRKDGDEEVNVNHSNPEHTLGSPDLERDSTFIVTEAVLVEEVDDEVYAGTPVEPPLPPLPWWKLIQVRIALACVTLIAVAITLGTVIPMFTNTNSTSITTFPSSPPTPPPTACVAKIGANMQKIDLSIGDHQRPGVAGDGNGKNAVVIIQDGFLGEGSSTYIIFHSFQAGIG